MKRILLLLVALLFGAVLTSAQTRVLHYPPYSGATLDIDGARTVFVDLTQQRLTGSTAIQPGDIMEITWWHSSLPSEPPVRIQLKLERDPGQSFNSFIGEFRDLVSAAQTFWPPNADPPNGRAGTDGVDDNGVMEISWKHDSDGDGPFKPFLVRARVEKRSGESSTQTANRLRQMVEAMQQTWPPNVDP